MDISPTVLFSFDGHLEDYIKSCEQEVCWDLLQKYAEPGKKVLEAGAGTGRWLAFLSSRGYEVVGIELNGDLVEQFKKAYPEIRYDIGDITRLPYPEGSFDVALSFGVVEHLVDGAGPAIRDMHRVLHDNGVAIVTVPFSNFLWKLERIKDMASFHLRTLRPLRAALGKEQLAYHANEQRQYKAEFAARKIRGLSYKLKFDPREGATFYEYRFTRVQFIELLRKNGLEPIEVSSAYPDDRVFQVFGRLVGTYTPGRPVALNIMGRFLRTIMPRESITHMLVAVCTKALMPTRS